MSALQGMSETTWSNVVTSLGERRGPQLTKCQGDSLLEIPDLGPVAKNPSALRTALGVCLLKRNPLYRVQMYKQNKLKIETERD